MKQNKFPVSKSVALLLDPDKASGKALDKLIGIADKCHTDYIMAGGSLTFNGIGELISSVKQRTRVPVVLFPGNLLQLNTDADIILLLSLISGRNPELLIGNHVTAAPFLRKVRNKLVPVGYILIGCGSKTSVEYISQTEAIPEDKPEIAVATALAGEMLGLKMIYLEAGSGSPHPVPTDVIRSVRENITIPLAVGGGLRNAEQIEKVYAAGADMIILGNGCEKNPELIEKACKIRDRLNKAL